MYKNVLRLLDVKVNTIFRCIVKCIHYWHRREKMYRYRIRDLREDNDLTQAEVAKVINTSQQQYSKIENGKSDISGEKLIILAKFYNVSVDYILGIE